MMDVEYTQDRLRQSAEKWQPGRTVPKKFRIITDTTDFFRVDYGDVVLLNGRPYLIGHNMKEGRFGLDEEVKHWVRRAVDLDDGGTKVIKMVFYESFIARVASIEFECFRSPKKEARILSLVEGRPNFMQGRSVLDEKGNVVRILDYIRGKTLHSYIAGLGPLHERYFFEVMPGVLDGFMECVEGIGFLHSRGEKHGDVRRDHIIIDASDGRYRWIDFDYNYRHHESMFGYDLFGLGNILAFIVGGGDVLAANLDGAEAAALEEGDLNIVFVNRVVNLKKLYPYIPDSLNRILMHFSRSANVFYESAGELLGDLREARRELG